MKLTVQTMRMATTMTRERTRMKNEREGKERKEGRETETRTMTTRRRHGGVGGARARELSFAPARGSPLAPRILGRPRALCGRAPPRKLSTEQSGIWDGWAMGGALASRHSTAEETEGEVEVER